MRAVLLSLYLFAEAIAFSIPQLPLPLSSQLHQLDSPSCPIDISPSCSNSTPIYDTCCFESPGGVLLLTQFWDYYPAVGDNESWTLHGLWPDNCDGSYEQFCNNALELDGRFDFESLFNKFGDSETWDTMQKYWLNFNGDAKSLWIHEYNKHGTCINTLNPKCYGSLYKENQNVYDYFRKAVDLYHKVPTYEFLTSNGIYPDAEKTYTKDEIAKAISSNFEGHSAFFKCNRYGALQEVWYFHHVKGSVRDGGFLPIDSMISSNCPSQGIKWYPKGWTPGNPLHPTHTGPGSPGKPSGVPGLRGHIKLTNHNGCLISNGNWYQYGTCATYTLLKLEFGGYNVKSSKGYCGVIDGILQCNANISPSRNQFQLNKLSKAISYGGIENFCLRYDLSHGSGKFVQVPVEVGGDCADSFKLILQ
ncbi:ribonuclease T2-like [Scheffersomyces spartinae]|uniref:Ribonuclease T2-like n=1 Tax=Scheffersomyces spartinae TaxID=45513 RepID=A0A9P7VEQ3_9ASCO|nr:ribonuclease T2-like [Scheffersomyces spartinae]KAG7195881.1 ribonuclease T2-like [Scheffersomyces spartinae]